MKNTNVKDFLGNPLEIGDKVIYSNKIMFNLGEGIVTDFKVIEGELHVDITRGETRIITQAINTLKLTPEIKDPAPETKWVFCSLPKKSPYDFELGIAKIIDRTKSTISVHFESGSRFMPLRDAICADSYVDTHPELFL